MYDPCEMIECERCQGTGIIQGSCPYSGDIDPECNKCAQMCESITCYDCGGNGWLTDSEYKANLIERSYEE